MMPTQQLSDRARVLGVFAAGLLMYLAGIVFTPSSHAQTEASAALGHRKISVGVTEDETEIKATAGAVYSITASNTNAAVRYLKCYNLTAANAAPGTSTPWLALAIPPAATSGNLSVIYPSGVQFSVALTCALVTGATDADVTEVAANEILWSISYR